MLPPGQPEPLAHVKGFRRLDPIQQKQPPLQLGLDGDVPYLPDAYQLVYIGMAGGIQAVVPQNPQQIGLRGLGIGLLAGLREEHLTAVGMVAVPQLAYGGVYGGIVVEENIRPMQTDVVESAEPTDALASFGGELGQRQFAETVMGVIGGHGYHLMENRFSSFYTNLPQKGSKIRKKFLYVLCKREKRLLFGRERAIIVH